MVEEASRDLDDVLEQRIASLKLDRDRAKTALERIKPKTVGTTVFGS